MLSIWKEGTSKNPAACEAWLLSGRKMVDGPGHLMFTRMTSHGRRHKAYRGRNSTIVLIRGNRSRIPRVARQT
jgi:hypothetical protein